MALVHGFMKVAQRDVAEIKTQATLWRHEATGAQLLSLTNDDENKVFGVSFRTPPPDATGVAHILEHSVLCGSRNYPVKEPFVELIKGSLNTFVNAFTYPDKTCYPVASTNRADFYNLIDVYLDAVFHPLLPEHILRQEGWRLEPDAASQNLVYKGVVLNEMKGAYSSPDDLLAFAVQRSLFPDTPYSLDSGGDPQRIPDLSYERFLEFHRNYYHPSNGFFYFSGDDPEPERLRRLDTALAGFERRDPAPVVPLQTLILEPRVVRQAYGVADEPGAGRTPKRSMVVVNWLLPEAGDSVANLMFQILDSLLIGIPASPLRKALIDSGLGEDLAGVGLELDLRQMYFSTGLKGVAAGRVGRVEPLVRTVLQELVAKSIPVEVVEAAVNSVEFELRENNTGRFPRGLYLMLRVLTSWLYGGDPFSQLGFEAPLQEIKTRLAAGEPLFENCIGAYLLRNPHRTTVILEPDPTLLAAREAAENARLAAIAHEQGAEGRARLVAEAQELKRIQETPDSPQALATIPRLKIGDLETLNKPILRVVERVAAATVLSHDLDTAGIVYLDLGFDMAPLLAARPELVQLMPLFGRCLVDMGTRRRSYVDLNMWIARKTGGIHPQTFASSIHESPGAAASAARFVLRCKATLENVGELFNILSEILLEPRLDDRERFRQLVLEEKAGHEEQAISSGHQMVASRLMARLSQAGRINEMCDGVSQLFFLRRLAKAGKREWPGLAAALECLRGQLVHRSNLVANLTVGAGAYDRVRERLAGFLAGLPEAAAPSVLLKSFGPAFQRPLWPEPAIPDFEGFTIPAAINFVGKAANLYQQGYANNGAAQIAARLLRNGWLWERVRVQGGAYGAFCVFDRVSGNFALVSYRDPNIKSTLAAFDQCGAWLRDLALDHAELEKNIVGTIGDIDTHLLPDAKGYASLTRWLIGDSDALRQKLRDEVLAASPAAVQEFGEALAAVQRQGRVTVIGGKSELQAAAGRDWTLLPLL